MNKNFLWKLALIVGILLIFLFGIFGIPKSFSGQGLLSAMTDHIHLGLDLKGGTHLILQVKVNDAVNVDAQNAIEVLKDQRKSELGAGGWEVEWKGRGGILREQIAKHGLHDRIMSYPIVSLAVARAFHSQDSE